MGVERVDYSSDDEYRQAQQMEEYQEQKWQEEQYAKEMEARMIAEEQEKESAPLDPQVIKKNAGEWKIGDEVMNHSGKIGNIQQIISDKKVLVDYGLYSKEEDSYSLESVQW